ncbi:MAG: hypothetical protein PHU07_12915, partial [Acidocella sp.]|nr:hypothetical protein [Acidocella sp.]
MKNPFFSWPNMAMANLAMQGAYLAMESQQVIALRLAKLAQGGEQSANEAALMVSEKVATLRESGVMMLEAVYAGKKDMDAHKVIQLYRKRVRANQRRLA